MIFLTLGTQLPFDRLVRAVDEVAADIDESVFGQIGHTKLVPQAYDYVDFLPPQEFGARFSAARVIVGHAGIGTILSGRKAEKPLILMARRASLGEHRNDHQMRTVEQLGRIPGVHVAENAEDIRRYLSNSELQAMRADTSPALERFHAAIKSEIFVTT